MIEKVVEKQDWDLVIEPKGKWFDLHLDDIWHHRELIWLFVKRDFVTFYKQTVLGPLWYIITPLLTTMVFYIVFGKITALSTDGIPAFLFYLSGNIVWTYFSTCLANTSNVFVVNSGMFGKVYFPRLTVPISTVIISMLKFLIQFILFLCIYFLFAIKGFAVRPNIAVFALPFMIVQMALLGLGFGVLVSAVTTKYRDLTFVMGFVIQLWMFLTPVIYPASTILHKWRYCFMLNPMASIIEIFRFAFLGKGLVEPVYIILSWVVTLVVFFAGVVCFNRIEKSFMDVI